MSPSRWTTPALVLALVGLFAVTGCGGKSSKPTQPTPPTPPSPSSPQNVVLRFQWGWSHLDRESFRQILSNDFAFVFAAADSAGNPFPGRQLGRDTVLTCVQHLFSGGGTQPKADAITLTIDPTLIVQNSTRGGNPTWHKQITTSVHLHVKAGANEYTIGGNARFFVVRGDSAAIPADLAAQGVGPDSTRWYMDRWEDETLTIIALSPAARATRPSRVLDTQNITWGAILALYR